MKLALLGAIISIFILTPNCYADDTNLFSPICYRFLSEGSWGYNLLIINNDLTAEFLRIDSTDKKNIYLPGRARGTVPIEIANKISASLQNYEFDPNQKPHPSEHMFPSVFEILTVSGQIIRQPCPDIQHQEQLPSYNELVNLFNQVIQYLKDHGSTTFISSESSVIVDDKKFVTFTIKLTNIGNTAITIENLLNMGHLASSYYKETGVGPIYHKNNINILNANFDVKQEILKFVPGEPLYLEFVSKNPINASGGVSFSILLEIKEVNDLGKEIEKFVTNSVVYKFDLP